VTPLHPFVIPLRVDDAELVAVLQQPLRKLVAAVDLPLPDGPAMSRLVP